MQITLRQLKAIIQSVLREHLGEGSVGSKSDRELIEAKRRMREADVTGDKKVKYGSRQHIKDLEHRINELDGWRQKHKKGSEHRGNYTRVINKLKSELAAAKRHEKG